MSKKINKKHINVALIALGLTALVAYIGLNNYYQQMARQIRPDTPLFTVGAETIYAADLQIEKSAQPAIENTDHEQLLKDKLVSDSITLQAAQAENLIALDSSIYNSPSKDYAARIGALKKIQEAYKQQQKTLEGNIVTVWFYNNNYIGPLGYAQSKQRAFEKITAAYKKVQSGESTMAQVIQNLKSDSSLKLLDPAYQNNTGFDFSVHTMTGPTVDLDINDKLWSLNEGSLSDILLAKDTATPDGNPRDALYLFAKIDKKVDGNELTFDQWVEVNKQKYEIKNSN